MPEEQICPKCGSPMVMRTARKGPNAGKRFYGCSKYPECTATVNIIEKTPTETPLPENVNPIIDNDIKINEGKLKERAARYAQYGSNSADAEAFLDKVTKLFSDESVRDRVLEPFKALFTGNESAEDKIRANITQTAVINAVMSGAPGHTASDAALSAALEANMASMIARELAMEIPAPRVIAKYFGPLSSILTGVLWIFKVILGVLFASFSAALPSINPLIFAELIVTDFAGVVFWAGFQEEKVTGKFSMPAATGTILMDETKKLGEFQMRQVIKLLNPANTSVAAERLKKYFET